VRPYRQKGRSTWWVKVQDGAGEWIGFTTGTKHKATAQRMADMLTALSQERVVDVLDLLHTEAISVPALYDRYRAADNDIRALRRGLETVDLDPLIEPFLAAQSCTDDTKRHYRALLRRLIPVGRPFLASELTIARIQRFIDEMTQASGTKRKAGAALRTFSSWLVRRGVLTSNPVREVRLPRQGPPRTIYLDTPDAKRLADAMESPYREFCALMAGSGIEVSVAINLRRRDVDTGKREIRAAGTKTHARDRVVRVADWAWPYVLRVAEGKFPDVRLFEGIPDRWTAGDVHRATIAKLAKESPVFAGYTMRDHRHTYAVRAMRAGAPADVIARQLGHASPTLVLNVYGRFQPTGEERDRWERAATAMDAEREAAR
jgi:integrase